MKGPVFLILLLIIMSTSCENKRVNLPTLDITGIQDTIYDNSKIWMFFKVEESDTIAELNKNNSVANTHWIFNIDKRLSLKHVIPGIQQLQAKKAKPSMHDNAKITHSYYSYVDTLAQKLSLVLFDSVKYIFDDRKQYHQFSKDSLFDHLLINFNKKGIFVDEEEVEMKQLEKQLISSLDNNNLKIHLNFDKDIGFQHYIHLKALLSHVQRDSIIIAKEEFIN